MAVLVGAGLGYWADSHWESTPVGVITGVVVGFAAMVLRLLRLGRELVPESSEAPSANEASKAARASRAGSVRGGGVEDVEGVDGEREGADGFGDAERGPAEMPALSDIWRDEAPDERD